MKIQTKTTLILIGTLIIGIVIGVLGSGVARRQMTRKFANRPFPKQFTAVFERIIGPDATNRDTVLAILQNNAEKFDQFQRQHEATMRAMIDSLNAELDPILTPEQKQRLDEHNERLRKRMENFHPGRGRRPHFPGQTPPGFSPGEEPPPSLEPKWAHRRAPLQNSLRNLWVAEIAAVYHISFSSRFSLSIH
jgi:hypothetical protein